MKQKFTIKGIASFLIVMIVGLVLGSCFGAFAAGAGVVLGNVGVVIPGVKDTASVDEAVPGLHLDDIDNIVTKMFPASAPLDQLLRTGIKDSRRGTESIKARHYSVETKPFDDVVTAAVVAANQNSFELQVGNIDMYGKCDTIFIDGVPGLNEAGAILPNGNLELYVYGIDKANSKLLVQPVNGVANGNNFLLKAGVQSIDQNAKIVRGGRALNEMNVQTDASNYVPTDDYNFCQYFGSQIEISKWENKHAKEVNWTEADDLEMMLYDYRVTREISYWFGTRRVIYPKDGGSKPTYTCGGLTQFINNQVDWTNLLTVDGSKKTPSIKAQHLDEMVRQAFSGNAGSGQRWMFVGEYLWNALKRTEDIQKTLSAKETEYKFGLYFNKINTGDGELVIVKHPLFKMMGYGYNAVIIDANNIGERHFKPQNVQDYDKAKLAQSNSDAKFVSEVSCPVVKYGSTHTVIKGPVYTDLI